MPDLLDSTPARMRVIVDNDFSGDPDDLFQLAHHVLSPSAEIRLVVGSHLRSGDPFDPSDAQADNAAAIARDLLAALGRTDIPVLAGSNVGLPDAHTPIDGPAVRAIIAEALRDVPEPLFFCAGAGLTDLASALLLEPSIAERMTVVWIGGREHAGMTPPPPGVGDGEYNLNIDIPAAQAVFDGTVPIWQVPRDTYRQVLVSYAELDTRFATAGAIGARLRDAIGGLLEMTRRYGIAIGETYILGDQPLVLLTALQSSFEADPSSSTWVPVPRPGITDDGGYLPRPEAPPIRVYTSVDTRMMIEDLIAKLGRAG